MTVQVSLAICGVYVLEKFGSANAKISQKASYDICCFSPFSGSRIVEIARNNEGRLYSSFLVPPWYSDHWKLLMDGISNDEIELVRTNEK